MSSISSSIADRAATLLGTGLKPVVVAASLGCSESYICDLLAQDDFASRVAALRYEALARNNERDGKLDTLEDKLIGKLDESLPLMHRPLEILKALQVVNAAKRRGATSPDVPDERRTVVTLVMPTQVIQQFTTNINNQVIRAGSQELLTIQSSSLASRLKEKQDGISSTAALAERVGVTS